MKGKFYLKSTDKLEIGKNIYRLRIFILFSLISFHANLACSDVKLPALFSENMVLQGGMKVPVWGWADPGERVTVTLGGHISSSATSKNGRWKVNLGPLDYGGPFTLKVNSDKNELILENVLVGEVWVCGGQSNMAMEVKNCRNAKEEISLANYPDIRHFQVAHTKSLQPLEDLSVSKDSWLNKWEICDPSTVEHFTGTGYFFARELQQKLQVPIGLINVSWGGTTAEAWTPREALQKDPELQVILDNWPGYNDDEEWLREEYEEYLELVEKAKKENTQLPLYFNMPSVLYNGIVAPVVQYGIKGVTWYQGESNAYRAYQYRALFPAMIKSWRDQWGQGDFPFLFVQLANYHFEPQVFPELREAQAMALSVPNTAMTVTIDIGDKNDIHPKNKQEVGRRLSMAALKMAYNQKIIYSGPVFQSMMVTNDQCVLTFDHCGDGLTTKDGHGLNGFVIAGSDKKFYPANAMIKGKKVIVSNTSVKYPVAVRYAWANHPEGANLYNILGDQINLPAAPFRTDDWPGLTINRR